MNVPNASFVRALFSRVLGTGAAANGGYVFNFRGRWRYQSSSRAHPRRDWGGEAFAYAWLSRQGADGQRVSPTKPDPQILAVIRG